MKNNNKNFVITSTPLRVSFAGGGSDFYDFFSTHEGAVVSSTIDKEIKVTVKRHSGIFNEKFRINYINNLELDILGNNEKFNKIILKKNKKN